MGKEQEQLAQSMVRLAEALEKATSPDTWRAIWEIGVSRMGESLSRIQALITPPPRISLPGAETLQVGYISEVGVTLAPEERRRMTQQVSEAIKPQLAQFENFVQEAIKDLPASKLQRAVELIDSGKVPKMSRKLGCLFLDFPDENPLKAESFYLKL